MPFIPEHTCLLSDKFNQNRIEGPTAINTEVFVIIADSWKLLANLTKISILDVAGVHDAPLMLPLIFYSNENAASVIV